MSKKYWIDMPWNFYVSRSGYTAEEALAEAEKVRERELLNLAEYLEWVRTVPFEVQCETYEGDD